MKRRDLFKRLAGAVAAMVGAKLGIKVPAKELEAIDLRNHLPFATMLDPKTIYIPAGKWIVKAPSWIEFPEQKGTIGADES